MCRSSAAVLLGASILGLCCAMTVRGSVFDWVGNQVVGLAVPGARLVQPAAFRVIKGIHDKRIQRGDREGAKRILEMKQWFQFVGMRRSVSAIATQSLMNIGAARDVFGLALGSTARFQKRMTEVGPLQTWQEQSDDLTQTVHTIFTRLKTAMTHGPVADFLKDLSVELRSEHLASDLLEVRIAQQHEHISTKPKTAFLSKKQQALIAKPFHKLLSTMSSALDSGDSHGKHDAKSRQDKVHSHPVNPSKEEL